MENRYVIYTDGSITDNRTRVNVGAGATIVTKNGRAIDYIASAEQNTTNNRMEILGVLQALEWAVSTGVDSILVISDSKYVINCAKDGGYIWGWVKKHGEGLLNCDKSNVDQWIKYIQLRKKLKSVEFKWVKGHSGDKFNEEADQLAKYTVENHGLDIDNDTNQEYLNLLADFELFKSMNSYVIDTYEEFKKQIKEYEER